MTTPCQLLRLRQLPAGKIAGPDVENLPLPNQLLHRLPDFFPRRLAVHMVHLIQIDAVHLKTPQARFTRSFDMQSRQARLIRPVAHTAVHFRRQHDLVTTTTALGKPTTEDLFGPPLTDLPAIDIRRIKEVDTEFERAIHDRETVRFTRFRTEVHRAEAEPADFHT